MPMARGGLMDRSGCNLQAGCGILARTRRATHLIVSYPDKQGSGARAREQGAIRGVLQGASKLALVSVTLMSFVTGLQPMSLPQ